MSDEHTRAIGDLREAIDALSGGLSHVSLVLAHHGTMLQEIVKAVSDREESGESPLMAVLTELIGLSSRHARSLDRIEDKLSRIAAL